MKRQFLRRYGEHGGIKIPDVMDSEKVKLNLGFNERNKEFSIKGEVLIINRINRFSANEFVNKILKLRLEYPDKILYLPGFGLPMDYPVLFYLGIDLLDDSPLRTIGDGRCLTEFGIIKDENCIDKNQSERKRVMEMINQSLEKEMFRDLVESHSFTPFSKEALRIIDMNYFRELVNFTDYRPKRIRALNMESLYRPEITEYRSRIKEMKQTAPNLLLIPCSAIKPYSLSKTHRILHSRIYPFIGSIQEVIVTSPLGLVPRELENFFPVKYYDIPVTGYWFNEEKVILESLTEEFLRGKEYENIFFILSEQETSLIKSISSAEGIIGNLNMQNSEKLYSIIKKKVSPGNGKEKMKIEMCNIAKYFYNIDLDPKHLEIRNEGNRTMVYHKGKVILKKTLSGVSMEEGMASLLLSEKKQTVEVNGIFKGSNIFVPGVTGISKDVKPGMEISLVFEDRAVGRGIAELSELDLKLEKRGIAISDVKYFQSR